MLCVLPLASYATLPDGSQPPSALVSPSGTRGRDGESSHAQGRAHTQAPTPTLPGPDSCSRNYCLLRPRRAEPAGRGLCERQTPARGGASTHRGPGPPGGEALRHLPPAPSQPWLCQQDPWQVSTKFSARHLPCRACLGRPISQPDPFPGALGLSRCPASVLVVLPGLPAHCSSVIFLSLLLSLSFSPSFCFALLLFSSALSLIFRGFSTPKAGESSPKHPPQPWLRPREMEPLERGTGSRWFLRSTPTPREVSVCFSNS